MVHPRAAHRGLAAPFVFAQGRRRTAVIALATFCALTALTWVLIPTASTQYRLYELPRGTANGDTSLPGNQSLLGVLARSGVSGPVGRVVWLAAFLGLGLWPLFRVRALHRNHRPLETLAVVAALLVVLSPVSWTHHQLLITIAALWPVSVSRVRQISWSALVLLVMSVNLSKISATGPLGWALENSRFLLALTIIVALPSALAPRPQPEIRSPRFAPTEPAPLHRARNRPAVRRT